MPHFDRLVLSLPALAVGSLGLAMASTPSHAAQVTYRFTTTINMINPLHASFPASLAGVSVGAPVTGTITYDTASPSASTLPSPPYSFATRYTLNKAKYRFIVGGAVMNSWNGQPNTFVWNNDPIGSGGANADGLIITNFPTTGNIQFQLGNLALPTSVFAGESLPGATLTGGYLMEMYGFGGAGGPFLRTAGWSGLTLVPNCPADINGDVQVNVLDLLAVITAWGSTAPGINSPSDVNDDSIVNVLDLLAVITAWGPCP